jgi:hypothetical protein
MATVSTTSPVVLGGFMIPWATLRTLLPDTRWALYGAASCSWISTRFLWHSSTPSKSWRHVPAMGAGELGMR